MATPEDESDPALDAAHREDDDAGDDDALADRLAQIDDLLAGKTTTTHDPVGIVDDRDAVTIAGHLDVILRLREAGERSRGESRGEAAGREDSTAGALVIGSFLTLHEIGRGGFAIVYEAVDQSLDRHVALKVIRPETPHLPGLQQRFLDDARLAARINHPHVVTVYEVGKVDGFSYIAQELCTGGSLADWLARHPGPADPRLAAEIIRSLAGAADAAHSRNVLHRDITPSNVLLAADPLGGIVSDGIRHRAKLADFGLAKLLADDGGDAASRLTRADARPGTPAWMAPEQVDPEAFGPVGPATDIHALGLLLDRLLTGITPHAGRSATEIYRLLLLSEPRPPDEIVRGLPPDLVAVTLKARAKRPQHRYGSAAELATDLGRFLDGLPTLARPLTVFDRLLRGGRRRAAALSLTLALGVAIVTSALVVWQYGQVRQRDEEGRLRARAELARQAFDILRQGDVKTALERVAAPELAGSLPARWLRARTHAEEARLIDRADPASPFAVERHDLYSIGLARDGSICVGGADGTLFVIPPGAAAPTLAVQAHDEINDVVFSPDGRFVATVGEDGAVRLWRAADGAKVGETGSAAGVFGVAFAPAGDRIAWGGRSRTVEIQSLEADGTPVGPIARYEPFTANSHDDAAPDTQALVFLDDDTIAAASGSTVVFLRAGDGQMLRSLDHADGSIGDLELSADRSMLVTIGTARIPHLWETATGTLLRRLPLHPHWVQGCGISPDGTEIVTGCRDGVVRVFAANSGDERARFVGHVDRTWDVKWEASGSILSCGADGSLRRWDRHATPAIAGFREESLPHGPAMAAVPWGFDGDWLVAAASSPAVICNGPRGPCREAPTVRFRHPWQLASTADRSLVVVADTSNLAADPRPPGRIHELIAMTFAAEPMSSAPPIFVPMLQSLACLPDGTVLAGSPGRLVAWRRGSTTPLELASYDHPVDHLAVTQSGGLRVAVAVGSALMVLPCGQGGLPDVRHQRMLVDNAKTFGQYIVEVAWSPDGKRIAYGNHDGELRIIDADSGAPLGASFTLGGDPMGIVWGADGRSLLVADRDVVRLYDASTGTMIEEVRPGWPISSIGLDDAPGRPGLLIVAGGLDHGRLLRLDLGRR